jgi:phospholipase C
MLRTRARAALFGVVAVAATAAVIGTTAAADGGHGDKTATPIKHLVVIFQENVSYDHYFGTYPNAANTDGSAFAAAPGTSSGNNLSAQLLAHNPNLGNPRRLDSTPTGIAGGPGGQITCDQDHNYSDEQQAFDNGLMDQFVQSVGSSSHAPGGGTTSGGAQCDPKAVMDYYDGNSVTALWNYAQRYSMSDNSFGTTFGPSAPGAINVVSGDTGNVDTTHEANSPSIATSTAPNADVTPDGLGGYSLTSDAQPYWDDCSTRDAVALSGKNIGDELNAANISWGWFQGGFSPTTTFAAAATANAHAGQPTSQFIPNEFNKKIVPPANASDQNLCDSVHPVGVALGETVATHQFGFKDDYIAHHEPFQYYASTANPHHLAPASLSSIGTDTQKYIGGVPRFDTANHNYDSSDFDSLVSAIASGQIPPSALPAVTYLKAPGYQDGHGAYSEPADEQAFIVKEINALEKTPDWSSTAVIVNYDDSDGWYDHVYSGVLNPSSSGADNLTNTVKGKINATNPTSGQCGTAAQGSPLAGEQGRCGLGPRLPLVVVSPCAAPNAIDSNLSSQASIVNFIEYNWHLPAINGSFDQALKAQDKAEGVDFDLEGLFDFRQCDTPAVQLDPVTGQVDLRNTDKSNHNLRGYNLSGAEANNASFANSNLEGAFAENATLTGGNLDSANLKGVDFTGANLQGANLQGSNLNGANFRHANLSGAHLGGADVKDAIWSDTVCPDGSNSSADGGTCVGHS